MKCLITSLVVFLSFWFSTAFAQVVHISDSNLNQALREVLEILDGNITQQDMAQLTKLGVTHRDIADITGIEYAVNLVELSLSDNPIQDITPLAGLVNLELLHLPGTGISDVTPIANLVKLKYLYLHGNEITDITPLSNLTELMVLELSGNHISDITPLSNLTKLERLEISRNEITDFSPLEGLPLITLIYDQECLLPGLPVQARLQNRNLPSLVSGFGALPLNLPMLSRLDALAYYDFRWGHLPFGLYFENTPPWSRIVGDLESALAEREELLSRNPNMLFLAEIRVRNAHIDTQYVDAQYPADWFGWLRDEHGNLLRTKPRSPTSNLYAIDLRLQEVHDLIVEQAISASKCGLYDGIVFDTWGDAGYQLTGLDQSGIVHVREHIDGSVFVSIMERIRAAVPDDFLIVCNTSLDDAFPAPYDWARFPLTASYANGGYIEVHGDMDKGFSDEKLAEAEGVLLWLENNVRQPAINCLRPDGIPSEPPDGPINRRWMRFFTTMSLTLTDGFVIYTAGVRYGEHIWYDFWGADLGQPLSPKAQYYQNIPGIYIREFTNGWAVYNRSGNHQVVTLPGLGVPVSDREQDAISSIHHLPDLDGEIYLRIVVDLNGDGVVNVLDLIIVANAFGTDQVDVNRDGQTDILDLVLVGQQFSER